MKQPEIIVALDLPSAAEIEGVVDTLGDVIGFYKIGLELFTAAGPQALEPVSRRGKRIFLDLKLHDIPRTVANSVKTACRLGVNLMTVHAGGGRDMLKAASEAAGEMGDTAPRIVAVTVLTSLNDADLSELGVSRAVSDHALSLGELAISAGIDGLVCSVQEAPLFREKLGADPILVTPGIRPADTAVGDQKRVATPAMAVEAGADFLVVGRPILQAASPRQAAIDILTEMTTTRE